MLASIVLALFAGGLLTVERKAFLQAALSRPLVASCLVGACLGEPAAGALVGAPLELLFLGSANLGAALVENETLAACAVAAAAAMASRLLGTTSVPAASLALLALVPFGIVGRALDRVENSAHQKLADRAMKLVDAGRYRAALRMNWRSLWMPFCFGACITLLGIGIGSALAAEVPHFSARAARALDAAFLFASGICAAAAVRNARASRGVAVALIVATAAFMAVLLAG